MGVVGKMRMSTPWRKERKEFKKHGDSDRQASRSGVSLVVLADSAKQKL